MSGDPQNNIESIVAEAVKAKVGVMVIDALGEPGELVKRMVQEALMLKVKDRDYPYTEEPVIHKIVRKAIVEEARSVMEEWIAAQRPAIHKELARRIQVDKADIASALIDSLAKVAGNQYGLRIVFADKEQ